LSICPYFSLKYFIDKIRTVITSSIPGLWKMMATLDYH